MSFDLYGIHRAVKNGTQKKNKNKNEDYISPAGFEPASFRTES